MPVPAKNSPTPDASSNQEPQEHDAIIDDLFDLDDKETGVVAAGDGEIVDSKLSDPPQQPKKKKVEKKVEEEAEEISEQDETEDVKSDYSEEDDETTDETPAAKKKHDTDEDSNEIELSSDTIAALKQYGEDYKTQIEGLVKANKELQSKLSSYGAANNLLQEFGVSEENQSDIVALLKNVKQYAEFFNNNPQVVDLATKLMQGEEIPEQFKVDIKTVNDFMPKDEDGHIETYDASDAVQVPGSHSWNARIAFEKHNRQQELKRQKAIEDLNQIKESSTDMQRLAKVKEQVVANATKVKEFAEKQYRVSEDQIKEFFVKIGELDDKLIQTTFAVYAKMNGIKAVYEPSNGKNGGLNPESVSPRGNELGSKKKVTKKDEDDYSNVFNDWDTDDSAYLY